MKRFECHQCGAFLNYEPGTTSLKCPYCGFESPIDEERTEIKELDFDERVGALEEQGELEETLNVKCSGCGAELKLGANVTADTCPYCATPIVTDHKVSKKALKPGYLLPFTTPRKEIHELLKRWVRGLWFAPNSLKKLARDLEGIKGVYAPYWTYDANTSTEYSGMRGDYYYVEEPVTVMRDGRAVTEMRMVQKIQWTPAQGRVNLGFDDVLALGGKSLPGDYAQALEPWDLGNLTAYNEEFLSGFICESYQIGPSQGFAEAKKRMEGAITTSIMADIGGDVQQIEWAQTAYSQVKFKHILLPVWINSYSYQGKVYHFMVNARTGEVQGERPWSWVKIALFAAALLLGVYGFAVISGGVR